MEESVHEEAGKENEETSANLSPAEEATSKDEVEIRRFAGAVIQKHSIQDLERFKRMEEIFLNHWKSLEILKTYLADLDLLLPKCFIFVRKQNGTEYEPGILSCSSEVLNASCSSPSPERYLLPN